MKVVHCMRDDYDVYIGRGKCPKTGKRGIWGNPFSHKPGTLAKYKAKDLADSLQKHRDWLLNQPELMAKLHELKDKTLGCWCRPKGGFKGKWLCHGQTYISLIKGITPEEVD